MAGSKGQNACSGVWYNEEREGSLGEMDTDTQKDSSQKRNFKAVFRFLQRSENVLT